MDISEDLATNDEERRGAGLNPRADVAEETVRRMAVAVLNFIWIWI